MLSEIYDKVVYYSSSSVELRKEFDKKVDEILKPLEETKSESEITEIRELIYTASYYAEKCGFMIGTRFMAKFLAEAIGTAE